MFYVATIDSSASNRGASTCCGSLCAASVANSAANDTFAHEVAHILTDFLALWDPNPSDPSHSTDATNLLANGDIRNVPSTVAQITVPGSTFDRIAPIQETAMLDSQLCSVRSAGARLVDPSDLGIVSPSLLPAGQGRPGSSGASSVHRSGCDTFWPFSPDVWNPPAFMNPANY